MKRRANPIPVEPPLESRADEYCRTGELVARYLSGLADGLEAAGDVKFGGMVHRLMECSHELNFGTLYVKHGYREPGEQASHTDL